MLYLKKILLFVLFIFLAFSLSACGNDEKTNSDSKSKEKSGEKSETNSNSDQNNTDKKQVVESNLNIAGFWSAIQAAGMTVGEPQELAYVMIGAADGSKKDVNGSTIEIYYFDSDTVDAENKAKFESAKQTGEFDFFGFKSPVLINGNLMICNYSDSPDKDKIISIFESLK
ncbi:MAG: hypothetical protein K0R18_1529 [Bacillales bacterium]|jgi:uncharacterized lipoprotein YehR (DUF1307 family)|nr:hypothetical protein [Bacillales bacterium]